MSESKKLGIKKPHFKIEIQDFQERVQNFKEGCTKNNVYRKPPRSAKNIHQLSRFNFDENTQEVVNTERKLRAIYQLERERDSLKRSLQVLKESAVSAIAEKEDQIEKLKQYDFLSNDEKLQYYECQLKKSQIMVEELQEERDELCNRFEQQRNLLIRDVQSKEEIIDHLYENIQQISREVQRLQANDQIKSKKIRILQEENHRLALQVQSINSSYERFGDLTNIEASGPLTSISSVSSQVHSYQYTQPNQSISNDLDNFDKSYLSQKFEEIDKSHRKQISQIKTFYQHKIRELRGVYQKALELPIGQQDREPSIRSRSTKSIKHRDKKGQIADHYLYLNLKDMYSIQEQSQQILQTSRSRMNDLKCQIKMQTLSQYPDRRITQQNDVQSQFTTKYFQCTDYQFMKKGKSSDSIALDEQETEIKTELKIKHNNQIFENNQTEPVEEDNQDISEKQKQIKQSDNSWRKSYIFGAGLLSGAGLFGLINYFINKSK